MLKLDGVRWSEGDFTLSADWSADPGDRIAVIGPSGAGKSTLLALIAGFLAPSAGRITWQGRDLGPLAPGARPISILFQDQNLFPHLTLTQNLGFGLSPNLRLGPDDAARIDAALTRVGLADLGSRKPGQLSGGQQSRAALARALLRARPILLLDEPFAALGPALKVEMLTLVREVAKATGALTLLVTHDPNDARQFARRTILVDVGRAAPPQDTEALFAHPPSALRDYLGT
ncbi:MAG: ATP-binding cassette domain-containing protein [Pseudorhodobacter sp.]|nr:ATP-binding cassette domain-containing protein [Pseudorhodobacter sp.]